MTCLKLSPNLRKVSKPADEKQKVEDLEVTTVTVYVHWCMCIGVVWDALHILHT